MTTETFIQSPVTTNTPRKKIDVPNGGRISLESLTETTKGFNRLTLQPTINDSSYYNSDKDDAKSNPKRNQVVGTDTSDGNERKVTATDTTKGNSAHKLITNQKIPAVILAVIPPVNQTNADGVATSGSNLHAVHAVLHKDVVTGAARRAARVFKDPPLVNWKDTGRTIPRDRNTAGIPPRDTTLFCIGTVSFVTPISIRSQNIEGPRRPIIPQEVRNSKPLDASINVFSEHRNPMPICS